jgi:diketogulonate reductase-like aldo/keto reductase
MPGHSVPTEDQVYAHLTKSPPKLSPGDNPYIDLMLIHAPRPNAAARAVHWAALARAQKEGWIRDIGVSNFGVPHLEALPGPTPAVNQVELHPFCQQRDIVEYCRKHGIVVQAYCPLVRAKEARMRDPTLMRVAQKHGKEVAQVLLKWSLQKG